MKYREIRIKGCDKCIELRLLHFPVTCRCDEDQQVTSLDRATKLFGWSVLAFGAFVIGVYIGQI